MTIDLDTIAARANAATPGPWTVSRSSDHPGERHIEAGLGAGVYVAMDISADDAALISACRTDIPALVARVRELEAERERNDIAFGAFQNRIAGMLQKACRDAGSDARIDGSGSDSDEYALTVAEVSQGIGGLEEVIATLARERLAALIDAVELRATLANERGEGDGPSEGWTWDGNSCAWLHGLDADGEYPDDGWTVEQTPAGQDLGWTWEHTGTRSDPYPYARDAMRAADVRAYTPTERPDLARAMGG